jgi:hypothetical protein
MQFLVPIAPYVIIGKVIRKCNIDRSNSKTQLRRFDINSLVWIKLDVSVKKWSEKYFNRSRTELLSSL